MRKEQLPSIFTRTLLSAAVAAACGLNAGPAAAQGAQQQESTGLEEIVVTARFKEEKLQETPIAITAVTGEELQSRGFQNAYEIAYTVPNASLRPAQAAFGASMSAYIRGIGQYDFLPEFEPGVAIYFDDVLHPVTFASAVDLMDLERVEVLRGPQGTVVWSQRHRRRDPLHQQAAPGRRHRQHLGHLRRLQPCRPARQLRLQALGHGVRARQRCRQEARRLPERL
jgi:hypothetical protein